MSQESTCIGSNIDAQDMSQSQSQSQSILAGGDPFGTTSGSDSRSANQTEKQTDASTDARDFVESVMGSQRVVRVETPINSSRKKHVSVPSDAETEADLDLDSSPKRVRRSLNSAPDKADETVEVIDVESVTQKNANSPLEHLIKTLSADMHMMFSALTERVDKLESGLEQRISNKVAQLLRQTRQYGAKQNKERRRHQIRLVQGIAER